MDLLNENWRDNAECIGIGPGLFYSEKEANIARAKNICQACVARLACLDYALQRPESFGVWGGLTEPERRQIIRRRRA